jgi:hypothetical protein
MIEPTNWWKRRLVLFLAEHTPKCHDITRLISHAQDGPLPLTLRVRMWLHYRICVWCERYRGQLRLMRGALRRSEPNPPSLSSEARSRLKAKAAAISRRARSGTR